WRCSGEHREALQVAQPERERLAGHGKPANQYVVASTRLEALSHHDIFGATTPQRYPPALAHGPLERVERLGRQRTVLGNRRGGTAHFQVTVIAPATPRVRRPIRAAAGVPSRSNADTSAPARSGSTAIKRPPDVCASNSRTRIGSGTWAANFTSEASASRLRVVPPGIAPRSASSTAFGNSGTDAASISAATPLAASMLCKWPSRPKPVTSVAACTPPPVARIARAAPAFNVAIDCTAAPISAAVARSRFKAVVSTPVPIGLVSTSASPARARASVTMRL